MVWATWLADAARLTGYPVNEVSGWKSRGHGQMSSIQGVVGHHTATSAKAAGDYPSLAIVRDGRSDLPGPLSNLGLGRSGTIYVIAAGLCYHAGASAWAGFTSLNSTFLGIEAENDGSGNWTDAQLDAYPKLVGALLKQMGRGVERYVSHRTCATPAGRKPDPAKISDDWMRERAHLFMSGGTVPPAVPAAGTPRTLRRGDTGDDVRELQRVLNAWYGGVAQDGVFGAITEASVKRAQKNTPPQPKLDDDGICGPLTWKKLGR
jgi:hypothetical protein